MDDIQPGGRAALNIGRLLRGRRHELDMTLDQVASAADLTKSFLSDIERDKTSPSVASLVRLCEVLSMRVGDLFAPARSGVVRADDRPPIRFGGTGIADFLVSPAEAQRLQVILSELEPGGSGGDKLYTLPCEEEFVFVLEGSLRLTIADTVHELGPGDSMAFDPRRLHTFANASAERPARALFVLTPPPL